jgi:EAL domain-containing protein (putative c-di-GMP-specific phosphodiesterase class I)
MQLLAKELATRQWKTHIYHDHKIRAMDMKRRKLNRKFLYWKAWKDYIKKKKFQTDSNVATLKFAKCNQEMLIKQIFDALKVHKEQMKFEIMEDCMENEMKPEIESLNKDVDAKRKKADRSGR